MMTRRTHRYFTTAALLVAVATVHVSAQQTTDAGTSVPDVDEGGLIGTRERIRDLYRTRWESCGATGLNIRAQTEEELELMADLAGTRDV